MTRIGRRIMLTLFALFFFMTLPPVIFYSRGYRLAFSPIRFIQTGTIAIHSQPKGAKIWLDGKDTGRTTPDAIGGIKAGRYKVEVSKDGYVSWSKTLEVFPDLQTWASQVVLVPEKIDLEPLVQGKINEFGVSPDFSSCVFRSAEAPRQLQWLKLKDGKVEWARVLGDLDMLDDPARYELDDFQWSPDSKRVLFAVRQAKKWSEKPHSRNYLVVDPEESRIVRLPPLPEAGPSTPTPAPPGNNVGPAAKKENVEAGKTAPQKSKSRKKPPEPKPTPLPPPPPHATAAAWMGSDKIVAFANGTLYIVRYPELDATPMNLTERLLAYGVASDDRIVYLSAEEPVLKRMEVWRGNQLDLIHIDEAELSTQAGLDMSEPIASLFLLSRDRVLLLMKTGLLFFIDPIEKTLSHVAEGVENVEISPDLKKIAYSTRYEIGVYYLEVTDTEPRRLPGYNVSVIRPDKRITGFSWHKLSEHIIVATGDSVSMIELDDRNGLNVPLIATSQSAVWDLDYNGRMDILYLKRSKCKDPEGLFSVNLSLERFPMLPL